MSDTGSSAPSEGSPSEGSSPEGPSPEVGEDYVYGPDGPDDGQQYVDRDAVPFDPEDGLLTGTAFDEDESTDEGKDGG